MSKKTLGSIVTDLNNQHTAEMVPVLRKAAEMKSEYMENLLEAVDRGCNLFKGDFFIEVTSKKEKLLDRVHRDMFTPVAMCPAAFWDQSVFRYNRFEGRIEYLWTLPGRNEAIYLAHHAKEALKQPEATGEAGLVRFLVMLANGTLNKMTRTLNKEPDNSPMLINSTPLIER